jgi:hypothetical protein
MNFKQTVDNGVAKVKLGLLDSGLSGVREAVESIVNDAATQIIRETLENTVHCDHDGVISDIKVRIPYTMEEIKNIPSITGKLAFENLPKEIQEEVEGVHEEVIMMCESGNAAKWEERFCEKIGAFIDGDRKAGKKFFGKLYDYFCDVKHHDFGVTYICLLEEKMS